MEFNLYLKHLMSVSISMIEWIQWDLKVSLQGNYAH